jgi:uncharacterized protein with PQ loop repeat
MINIIFTAIGYLGSSLIATMQIPQIYHTVKSGKIKDLSLCSIFLNMFASACMFSYSSYYKLYPITIASGCVVLCDTVLISIFYYYKNKVPLNIEGWELDNNKRNHMGPLYPKNDISI